MMRGRLGSRFTKATQWRVGQRLPQSQLAGRSLRCLVLAKFPEPDGTGGESILGFLASQTSVNGRLCYLRASVASWLLEQMSGTCHSHSAVAPGRLHSPGSALMGPQTRWRSADRPQRQLLLTRLQLKVFCKVDKNMNHAIKEAPRGNGVGGGKHPSALWQECWMPAVLMPRL